MKKLCLLFLLSISTSPIIWAEIAPGHETTNPIIRGVSVSCGSFDGHAVTFAGNRLVQPHGAGVLAARIEGKPYIVANPIVTKQLPDLIVHFLFAHECAHHALSPNLNSEPNADCYAIKKLRDLGLVHDRRQLDELLQLISRLPGSEQGHLFGPNRAAHIYACLNTP